MVESPPRFGVAAAHEEERTVLAGLWFGWPALEAWWPSRRSAPLPPLSLPPAVRAEQLWVFPAASVLARSTRFVTRLGGGALPDPRCTVAFPALGHHEALSVWLAALGPLPPEAVRVPTPTAEGR